MKVIASTDEYTIYQRRDGRYAVKGADNQPINAEAKVAILLQHELIVAAQPKAPEAEQPEEAAAEEPAGDEAAGDEAAAETAEDAPAEEAGGEEAADAADADKQ